jgi:hypothetical protein
MANMLDYLDWRGDVPFSADPFNEVDSLVLSEAAYVDFEGIVPGLEEGAPTDSPHRGGIPVVRIADVVRRFWELHNEAEIQNSGTLYKLAPYVLDKLCTGARFGDMMVGGYVNTVSQEKNEQMSAITFFLSDGSAFTAFRGTDDTLIGWKEDFTFSFMKETEGQKSAVNYLNRLYGGCNCGSGREALEGKAAGHRTEQEGADFPVRVGGHSKGGNFAVFAASFCDKAVRDRIVRVYTNDGPGFLEEVTETEGYLEILPRINSVIPEESLFGVLLTSRYYHKMVRSSEKGIWQHDALSWQIKRNHFEEAEKISEGSLMLKKTIETWVYGMTPEQRRETVDIIFTILEDTGFENVSEFASEHFKSIGELARAYSELSGEEKRIFHETGLRLLKSGASSIAEELQDQITKQIEKMQHGGLIG